MRTVFLSLFAITATACDPIPVHYSCDLPTLETDLPHESLVEVSTKSYFSNKFPVAIATRLEIRRDYGNLRMEWWGDPHRLYIKAISKNGELFQVSGENIEERYETFLSEDYTAVRTFHRPNFVGKPVAINFYLELREIDGILLEVIPIRYDTQSCTCVEYDSL